MTDWPPGDRNSDDERRGEPPADAAGHAWPTGGAPTGPAASGAGDEPAAPDGVDVTAAFATPVASPSAESGRHAAAPRSARRVVLIAGSVVLALLVLGGGAFAAFRMLGLSSVNPAERLPDSVAFYTEVNLDPSFDQTPKLFDLIDTFGGWDELGTEVEDFEDVLREALEQMDLEYLESAELTSWIGTRAAVAAGATAEDELYGVLALASRDDEAAKSALAKIAEESDDEFGYVVDDGLVTVVIAESDPQAVAETVVADGRESPLAGAERFTAAVDRFDRDQLLFTWVDTEKYYETLDEMLATFEGELATQGVAPLDLAEFNMSDATWAAVGAAATDDGIDIWYHSDAAIVDSKIVSDWRDQLGDLPMSQAAGVINMPEGIDDGISAQLDVMDAQLDELSSVLAGGALPSLDQYVRGQWEYGLAITDAEFAEWEELNAQWQAGEIAEGDADFDRLVELDDRYYWYGAQAEYDEWEAAGGEQVERWMFEQALTHDEYLELEELYVLFDAPRDELQGSDETRFYELDTRMFRYGLVSDYEFYEGGDQTQVDVGALIEEIAGLASGAGIIFSVDDMFADAPAAGVSVTLAEGPAERIFDLPESGEFARELADELGDDLAMEGSTLTIGELPAGGESLAAHPEFDAAFDGAPDDALWAVFVDVTDLNETSPEPQEWLEPVKAVSWVNGNTSGLIRVLID